MANSLPFSEQHQINGHIHMFLNAKCIVYRSLTFSLNHKNEFYLSECVCVFVLFTTAVTTLLSV